MCACVSCCYCLFKMHSYIIIYTINLVELYINACLYVHNIRNICLFKFVNSVLKAIKFCK